MQTIGLIGLGLMGMPMAKNLLDAGIQTVGYRRGRAEDFIAMGGKLLSSTREVIETADIVVSCIPNDAALQDIMSGPHGLLSADCAGKVLIELSTLSESVKRDEADKLAAKGGVMLDGAISGLPPMVAAKTAAFFVSGDEQACSVARPVLETLTTKLFFMGEFGAASRTKLCANMLVATNLAAIAETLAFGARQGIATDRLVEALGQGAGSSIQFHARASKMATGDWETALGATGMLAKDIKLIAAAAEACDCPTPVLAGVQSIYETALERGYGEKDVASIYGSVAQTAGLPIPGSDT
tara:strand:+ start:332 stop:1225 length:894 start_codon:yes stop_codon:yes gene_type:complete